MNASDMFIGEWSRSIDDRFRLSLPQDWADVLAGSGDGCVIAKEQPGCLSLWSVGEWQTWLSAGVDLLKAKIRSGRLERRAQNVQLVGRLLSTRHRTVPIAGRGRIAIPDAFRSFLGVDPGGEVLVVGAALCVEVWRAQAWNEHIGANMANFRQLFDELTD